MERNLLILFFWSFVLIFTSRENMWAVEIILSSSFALSSAYWVSAWKEMLSSVVSFSFSYQSASTTTLISAQKLINYYKWRIYIKWAFKTYKYNITSAYVIFDSKTLNYWWCVNLQCNLWSEFNNFIEVLWQN